MDYIAQLGPAVLDHRFRRITESLLRSAEEIYQARQLPFRARWASTYTLLYNEGPLAIGQIAERLRLTHPGVIGITNDMMAADIISAVGDRGDARRRLVDLTPRGREMSTELFAVWKALGDAQRKRFDAAGCDIMAVLATVDEALVEQPLAGEVLAKLAARSTKRRQASKTRRAVRAMSAFLFAASLASISAGKASAQGTGESVAAQPVSADARARVVNALSDSLINGYIYEEMGRKAADALRAELRSGTYDAFTSGDALATRINETLKRVANDRHLGVQYLRPAAGGTPVRRRMIPGGPPSADDSGRRIVRAPTDSAPQPASQSRPRAISAVVSAPEYGFASAQVLEGNIGYVEISGFSGDPAAIALTDSIMALFANTKAIIIDLGRNRGGGPPVIQRLSSYFFDKPVHLVSSFMRGMEKPSERWTSDVPGKRLPNTPVYVLTSRSTISAAESFTFGLRNHRRITVVGEPTAGGGHFGNFIPLTDGFSVFLPRGRTYNPVTNEGWETDGLQPDVPVQYEKALETALALAGKA
ncbi:MAG TPA: S41 family peptidase [Gemmatimonadaceae bacterium]|nr:S41 family peptidase [Gemmatimonadaceae bacterium]